MHRAYGAEYLMPTDPKPWTSRNGVSGWETLDEVPCPAGLAWLEDVEWRINEMPCGAFGTDAEFWFYAESFSAIATVLAVGRPAIDQARPFRARMWQRRLGSSQACDPCSCACACCACS